MTKAPKFSYPIYLIYNREHDSRELQQVCELLREVCHQEKDWSQRWDPQI